VEGWERVRKGRTGKGKRRRGTRGKYMDGKGKGRTWMGTGKGTLTSIYHHPLRPPKNCHIYQIVKFGNSCILFPCHGQFLHEAVGQWYTVPYQISHYQCILSPVLAEKPPKCRDIY